MAPRISTEYIFTSLKMLRITLVLFIVGEAVAQVKSNAPCPDLETVKDFKTLDLMGKWYENRKYSSSPLVNKCVTAIYRLYPNGYVRIKNSDVTNEGQTRSFTVLATQDKNGVAKFTYLAKPVSFWVLAMGKNKNWAIAWSCTYDGKASTRNAQILTRERYPAPEVVQAAFAKAITFAMDKDKLFPREQKNCPENY